ncbi:hypothetical protein SUGI_0356170 [Cryptomeria japonica]|nr:hypothetical protein SUGI_0356170 [Cryptomeria japonica]
MGRGTTISLLLTTLFLTCVAVIAYDLVFSRKRSKWPPCPPRLPLVGNLHQIMKGDNILSTLTDMAKLYGPVMTVWMGLSPMIILTGQTAIWEALVNQASNFVDRRKLYSRQYTTANFNTILISPCNERWTKLRKLLRNNVLSPFHIASQSSAHQACFCDLFNTLEKEMEANSGVVRPLYALKMMAVSFLARLCFGPHFQDQSFLVKLAELMGENIRLGDEGDTMLLDS